MLQQVPDHGPGKGQSKETAGHASKIYDDQFGMMKSEIQ